MFKKSILMLIVAAMMFSLAGAAKNANNNQVSQGIIVTDEVVAEIALMWAESFEPGLELQVGNIVPLIEFDGSKVGYAASYFSLEGEPYGYIVLNFSTEGYVDEFVIEEGALGMTEAILDNADVTDYESRISNDIVALHRTLPFQYAVSVEPASAYSSDASNGAAPAEKTIYGFYGEMTQAEFNLETESMLAQAEVGTVTYANTSSTNSAAPVNYWADLLIPTLPPGGHIIDGINDDLVTPPPAFILKSSAEQHVKRYACVVQAMMNVAQRHNLFLPTLGGQTSFVRTYNYLWNQTNTTVDYVENGIEYGLSVINRLRSGMIALANEKGITVGTEFNGDNPDFSVYKLALKANRSSIFRARVNKINPNGIGTKEIGHAVSVVGFREMQGGSGTKAYYLRVACGFNWSTARFINFNDHRMFSKYGVVYTFN